MDFRFDVLKALRPDRQGISILKGTDKPSREINMIIDTFGDLSSRSQGLRATITTSVRFFSSPDQKIYFKVEGNSVIGFLKIGYRKLFYCNYVGVISEISPLCLLDFYIYEQVQRGGKGLELYERMLMEEGVTPEQIAIDRPSSKLISFMQKHFGLRDYIPQNNNYVIFNQYFTGQPVSRLPQEQYIEQPIKSQENVERTVPKRHRQQQDLAPPFATVDGIEIPKKKIPKRPFEDNQLYEQLDEGSVQTQRQLDEVRSKIRELEGQTRSNFYSPIPPWATHS